MGRKSQDFTLEDFRRQVLSLARPGIMQRLMELMPGMGPMREMRRDPRFEKDTKRLLGIIDSMTPQERKHPKIIEPSRRRRIATGAGVRPQEVHQLVNQFEMMRPLVVEMTGKSLEERMRIIERRREDLGPNEDSPL